MTIPLTKGFEATIDEQDYHKVRDYNWYYNNGYAKAYHKGKRLRMHRLIAGAFDGQTVDHIDRNKLNNTKANLRICTTAENNRNVGLRKDNTTGYKGLHFDKSTGKWKPVVYVNGKAKTFGQYHDKRHAALAYDLWSTFFHKDFAQTNFNVVSG